MNDSDLNLASVVGFNSQSELETKLQSDGAKLESLMHAISSGRHRYSIMLLSLVLAKAINDHTVAGDSPEQIGHNLLNDAFTVWHKVTPSGGSRS